MAGKTSVARDPFARGEYERTCIVPHSRDDAVCRECGRTRGRLFSYRWVSDDNDRLSTTSPSYLKFCNLKCHERYFRY
jgi:hypothetical protein